MKWLFISYAILSLIGVVATLFGLRHHKKEAMHIGLWFTIFAMVLLYNLADGEILGTFFNYENSILYSINLLVLVVILSYLFLTSNWIQKRQWFHYLAYFGILLIVAAGSVLLINVWMNARFIETKNNALPIIQVANYGNNPHCEYQYVFYKMNNQGTIEYLCPNHYFLIPKVGVVSSIPDYIKQQFNLLVQKRFEHNN